MFWGKHSHILTLDFLFLVIYLISCDIHHGAAGSVRIYSVIKKSVTPVGASGVLVHGQKFQDLRCEGEEPLEWVYAGEGRPSKVIEFTRRTKTEAVQSQLNFDVPINSTEYPQHTGLYICRALHNHNNSASVYAYFPDEMRPFIGDGTAPVTLYLPEALDNHKFVIPCATSRPDLDVALYQLIETKNGIHDFKRLAYVHDPQKGFTLELTDNETISVLTGGYACKTEYEGQDYAVTYTVLPPKVVKPSPPDSIIYIGRVMNLTCEFNEPVVIRETESSRPIYDDEDDPGSSSVEDDLEETTETIPTNKHIANYVDPAPVPGTYGEFQCLTDNAEKKVLHAWNYLVIGREADELSGIKYSKKRNEFRCKSKANQPGSLSYVHCATPSECTINGVCLQKYENCRGYTTTIKTPHTCKSSGSKLCTKIKIRWSSHGFIRCKAEGIDEIRSFNDTGLRTEEAEPVLSLNLTLNKISPPKTKGHQLVNVTLHRSMYHFTEGQRWAVIYASKQGSEESTEDVLSKSSKNLSRDEMSVIVSVPVYPDKIPVQLICRVPLRASMDWRIISVHLTPEGDEGQEVISNSVKDATTQESPSKLNNDDNNDIQSEVTTVPTSPKIEFV